ncbi:MAG: hypothetical protein Q8J84_02100 [Flavobacteriaceae bacterium]|nr:hypothetical protein [Flavobacteriaceae bacterium]
MNTPQKTLDWDLVIKGDTSLLDVKFKDLWHYRDLLYMLVKRDFVSFYILKNKIEFYFDNFYVPKLTPMQCETRERNMLPKKMGRGWLIPLDIDEYIYDFKTISNYLKRYWYLTIFFKSYWSFKTYME